jgi:hypothetical protein
MNTIVYKETDDNWHGNFAISQNKAAVKVTLGQTGPNPPYNGQWRVGVWGNDDYGMVKDFSTEADAEITFIRLCKWKMINQVDLQLAGFIIA